MLSTVPGTRKAHGKYWQSLFVCRQGEAGATGQGNHEIYRVQDCEKGINYENGAVYTGGRDAGR